MIRYRSKAPHKKCPGCLRVVQMHPIHAPELCDTCAATWLAADRRANDVAAIRAEMRIMGVPLGPQRVPRMVY